MTYGKWCMLIGLLVLMVACEEEIVPPSPPDDYTVAYFQAPTLLDVASGRAQEVAVQVTHPKGLQAIQSIEAIFTSSPTMRLRLSLFDDGAALQPGSGDVIAGDGIYTNRLVPDSVIFPTGSTVELVVEVVDSGGDILRTDAVMLSVVANVAPVFGPLTVPDTLYSRSAPRSFSASVQDLNGGDDVLQVLMTIAEVGGAAIIERDLDFDGLISADSACFSATFDSSLAIGLQGDYQLRFEAVDRAGARSDEVVRMIYLENEAPRLFNSALADTVMLPASGVSVVDVTVQADEPQSLGDIQVVEVTVQRTGGQPSVIEMFDDGDFEQHRDVTAGDGIYSRGLLVEPTSTPGTYVFTFVATDLAGNTSTAITDTLEIIP